MNLYQCKQICFVTKALLLISFIWTIPVEIKPFWKLSVCFSWLGFVIVFDLWNAWQVQGPSSKGCIILDLNRSFFIHEMIAVVSYDYYFHELLLNSASLLSKWLYSKTLFWLNTLRKMEVVQSKLVSSIVSHFHWLGHSH